MKKIMLLITLSGMLAVVSFSFNVGGFIKDKVSEKVDETISNQMYTMSKPVIKYSKDKKEVFITGTIKNLGPKVNNVYVFVPCYDSKAERFRMQMHTLEQSEPEKLGILVLKLWLQTVLQ